MFARVRILQFLRINHKRLKPIAGCHVCRRYECADDSACKGFLLGMVDSLNAEDPRRGYAALARIDGENKNCVTRIMKNPPALWVKADRGLYDD